MINDRSQAIKKAGMLGIIGNIFLLIIKASIGFITNSQSMIADSINSASDIIASFMTFVGNKISSEPKDDTHNFGHGKAEYIFSLFISLTMILVSSKLLYNSIMTLIRKEHFTFNPILIIVCILTICTKLTLYFITKKDYKKYNSILLKSNYLDHRNDCLATSCTLTSIIFGYYKIYIIDSLVGIGISLWIFYTGFKILIESYNILMDMSIDNISKEYILELVKSHSDIKDVYNLYSTPVGNKYFIVFTIAVDGEMSTYNSHRIANHLEKDVEQLENVAKVIVHVHPSNMDHPINKIPLI